MPPHLPRVYACVCVQARDLLGDMEYCKIVPDVCQAAAIRSLALPRRRRQRRRRRRRFLSSQQMSSLRSVARLRHTAANVTPTTRPQRRPVTVGRRMQRRSLGGRRLRRSVRRRVQTSAACLSPPVSRSRRLTAGCELKAESSDRRALS
jgi:hypothetical protein